MTPEDVARSMTVELAPAPGTERLETLEPQPAGRSIGAGPTATPPAPHGPEDPGLSPAFGPNFVRFVIGRFAHVEQHLAKLLDLLGKKPQYDWRFVVGGNTDGSGNLTLPIFDSLPNQKFAVHRLYVHATGYTWILPFTGSGEALLTVDSVPWSGVSLVAGQGQLPTYFKSGLRDAVSVQDGERLALQINTGPVSTRIEARVMGTLTNVHGGDA